VSAHGCSFVITDRSPINWRATCRCKRVWNGPTYEAVEDGWREHVHATVGKVVEPAGKRDGRWTP